MKIRTIAVDLAKNVFEIGVSERAGHVKEDASVEPVEVPEVLRQPGAIESGDGSVWFLALLGPGDRTARP